MLQLVRHRRIFVAFFVLFAIPGVHAQTQDAAPHIQLKALLDEDVAAVLRRSPRAEKALGARFDVKDFHAVVLDNGSMPLAVLDKLVGEWIAGGGGRPGVQ